MSLGKSLRWWPLSIYIIDNDNMESLDTSPQLIFLLVGLTSYILKEIIAVSMRSISECDWWPCASLQRGQVVWMSDCENVPIQFQDLCLNVFDGQGNDDMQALKANTIVSPKVFETKFITPLLWTGEIRAVRYATHNILRVSKTFQATIVSI